jgi:hypothetical protein
MIGLHEMIERPAAPATPQPAQAPFDDPFDPVLRALKACDGVGREKTIALVLSAVESAFPR